MVGKNESEVLDYPNLKKIRMAITLFFNLSIALILSMMFVRVLELINISSSNNFPVDNYKVIALALFFDFVFFLKIIPFLFLPFLIFFLFKKSSYNIWVFGFLGSLLLVFYLLLIKYFQTALVPLGADLFGYSIAEINVTIAGSTKTDFTAIFTTIFVLALFWTLVFFFNNRIVLKPIVAMVFMFLGILLSYSGVSGLPKSTTFKTDYSYNVAINKIAFFVEKSTAYFLSSESKVDVTANRIPEKGSTNISGFKYLDDQYPFLRKDETEDVLSDFFIIDSTNKPNIVFIQVEGLGRAFSGSNAYLGSFTPFLDQLADKSIYFENFLASQGRTFATLPSILGSLPFGDKGFTDLGMQMPKFFSLQKILKHNGYSNQFFCGYDMNFDNQNLFIKKTGTSLMVDINNFESIYAKSPGGDAGESWGYADADLMRKTLQSAALNANQPSFKYVETMSMHTPYYVPDQKRFIKKFEKQMTVLNFEESKKKSYRQYENIYSSIMYTDDALSLFFKEYAKLPSFNNTIFIITGDHRLPEIPMSTKIDRYHVPLIIYSPMLKRTGKIRSISSHLDVTPSLLAFLGNGYHIKTPSEVTWLGSGLDTAKTFRNVHSFPMKQTKVDMHNYVSGLYFLDQNTLFTIKDRLQIEPVEDEPEMAAIKAEFNQFKARNNQFINKLKLMPDSLFNKFN